MFLCFACYAQQSVLSFYFFTRGTFTISFPFLVNRIASSHAYLIIGRILPLGHLHLGRRGFDQRVSTNPSVLARICFVYVKDCAYQVYMHTLYHGEYCH